MHYRDRRGNGFTLVELMIATLIMAVVALSLIGVVGNFSQVVLKSKVTTLATHLANEKSKSLGSLSFYQLMVTSSPVLDNNFVPPLQYDNGYYPPETITTGGTTFIRKTFVEKTDAPTGNVQNMGYPHPDTGLKRVTVFVAWQDQDNSWKKLMVSSLVSNPHREALDKRIFGFVTDSVTGLPVAGALIQARRNPGWGSVTDNTGYYSFQATDSTMKMISNQSSYYEYTSPSFAIDYGDNQFDFTMTSISTVVLSGYVVGESGLLLSQINCKWHATSDVEFIELYNGSTNTIDLTGYTLTHVDKFDVETDISMTNISTSIPGNGYFLFLGSQFGTDTVAPDGTQADAYFTALMAHSQQGGVILKNPSDQILDRVSWGNTIQPPPAAAVEGIGFDPGGGSPGIGQGDSIARKALSTSTAAELTPPSGAHINIGNAWDSQNNEDDFVKISTAAPRNSLDTLIPQTGTRLPYAIVSVDDGISGSVVADATGYFEIEVATGSWTVFAASTTGMGELDVSVTTAGLSDVIVYATSPATVGFITGQVCKYGTCATPFNNMLVQADPGGYQAMTNSDGEFWMALPADEEYFLNANPDFYNPDWNNAISQEAYPVEGGVVITGVNLYIWKNAYISGRVTTNGVDGLPGVAIVASGQFSNGNTAMTDAAGYWTIPGLRLIGNPYTVYPVLVEGQTVSPADYTVTVTQGNNDTGNDFVITGALVNISGQVFEHGDAIQNGVLILASTSTISASNPPDITFALRNGDTKYYQAVTNTTGNYSMPVVAGQTYNMIAWHTSSNTTTAKSLTVVVPTNTGVPNSDFNWP